MASRDAVAQVDCNVVAPPRPPQQDAHQIYPSMLMVSIPHKTHPRCYYGVNFKVAHHMLLPGLYVCRKLVIWRQFSLKGGVV